MLCFNGERNGERWNGERKRERVGPIATLSIAFVPNAH